MVLAKFFTGTKKQLDEKAFNNGCIYFITDTNEIYVDVPELGRTSFSSIPLDLDNVYEYLLEKLLSDPSAIFQGATETQDGSAGLVPVPEKLE